MSRKTQTSLLLSIIIALVFVLSGCGNSNHTNVNSSSNNEVESTSQSGGQSTESVELIISAAASMTDALTEIQQLYGKVNPSVKLSFNFGASGALQQQIEQGAPADLFLSAAVKNMNNLIEQQLIDSNQQVSLLKNELVIVVPSDTSTSIEQIEDLTHDMIGMLAIGIPESVPAGNYAKEALTYANLWEALQEKTVQAKDVRQVLQYVETGNVDAGFVYKTDDLTSDKVKVAYTVDPSTYPVIEYPIGIVKATKHMDAAEHFYQYLQSQEALDIFIKYGFSVAKD